MHNGLKQTITEIRSTYWIPKIRSLVKKILKDCNICKRLNARPLTYPTQSDLPSIRFDSTHAFNSIGVDYLGPLYCLPIYGTKDKLFKSYIVLYTCASSRNILLDVTHDATANEFVNSLKRFISRRGCPNNVVSDNGSVFTAFETQKFANEIGINWKYNLDLSPWWGGFFERMVGLVKRCIKKSIGRKRLTLRELQTLVLRIEMILNNRPLSNPMDEEISILTPHHLLFGRKLFENGNENNDDNIMIIANRKSESLTKKERMLENTIGQFWKVWQKEYITNLRQFHGVKRVKESSNIKLNDVLIIQDEKIPRHLWRLGRVVEILKGRDNRIRGAKLKIGTGSLINRPINRLYPLEMNK